MNVFIGGLLFGAFGMLLIMLLVTNETGHTPETIRSAQATCEKSGSVEKLYMDGDVRCMDGAFYDIDDYKGTLKND